MSSSFLDKIKYKKKQLGVVEKNGKSYVKYVKARRFKISTNIKYTVLSVFILVILGLGIKILMSELSAREPAEETEEEG